MTKNIQLMRAKELGMPYKDLVKEVWSRFYIGELLWLLGGKGRAGGKDTTAGSKKKNGYSVVQIRGQSFLVHRVIHRLRHGKWPPKCLDHLDGDPSNNSILNLRAVSGSENQQNQCISKNNTSGFKGVC